MSALTQLWGQAGHGAGGTTSVGSMDHVPTTPCSVGARSLAITRATEKNAVFTFYRSFNALMRCLKNTNEPPDTAGCKPVSMAVIFLKMLFVSGCWKLRRKNLSCGLP